MKRLALWFALFPLALLTQACSTYSYFDVDLKLGDGFTNVVQVSRITNCYLNVSGADNANFQLADTACHPDSNTLSVSRDLGKVRYSTFADSGDVTFKLTLFERDPSRPECELGHGSTTLTISSGNTVAGALTVPLTGTGCPP
jgi:hypothetical protein